MSGIVGMFHRNGAPVDRELLRELTAFLAVRGPDALETWSQGGIGFGHAMLRTTWESHNERQPACLDGRLWIAADARIDCRSDLRQELEIEGRKLSLEITDPELILHAYAAWGEECVRHLRGDFAFAIWDQSLKELFCARDHFGVKPFYYAEIGNTFVFSNTLNCVRLHPGVSDELNDDAVLDFLLVGLNCDNSTTTFKVVRRLPPAHFLKVSADGIRASRYYSLPVDGRIRYKRGEEYVEHFHSVWQPAVADRLRCDRVGIFLSGGLDSPTIAATVRQIAPAVDLRAYTCVYETLIPDQEGVFARQVADFLRIPIRLLPMDDLKPFKGWMREDSVWPEPVEDPFAAGLFDEFRAVSADCRIALNGHGGDDIMDFQMWPYTRDLLRGREWSRLLSDLPRFLLVRPFPWRGLWRRGQRLFGRGPLVPVTPGWIAPRWLQSINVGDRWESRTANANPQEHPILPRACAALAQPQWAWLFEMNDPCVSRFPVEVRYPFFDLRVVEYLLALPAFPWFFRKRLLRRAMEGRLPDRILQRRKAPLTGDPLTVQTRRGAFAALEPVRWEPELSRYIELSKCGILDGRMPSERARVEARPLCLNFWLRAARSARYNSERLSMLVETRNG